MSDLDAIKAMFDRSEIGYWVRTYPKDGSTNIRLSGDEDGVEVTFVFDGTGKLESILREAADDE